MSLFKTNKIPPQTTKKTQNKTNSMHMLSFLSNVKDYLFFEEQIAEKLKVPLDLSALVCGISTFGCVPCLSARAECTITDAFPSSKFLHRFVFCHDSVAFHYLN